MTDAWALIIATLITAIAGAIGASIKQVRDLRRENRNDHGVVMLKLNIMNDSVKAVGKKVDQVNDRLNDHIEWHLDDK
jgi:predicted proteasome-type protease